MVSAVGVGISAPAWAADGVDLNVSFGAVTFGAGSIVHLESFEVANAGAVKATGVTVTIDLISDAAPPALTFTAQRNGCAVVSTARVSCPLPDVDAGGSIKPDQYASAIEAHPVPGSSTPTPMTMHVKVTVSAAEPELSPSDNSRTSASILRTVTSGATDLVASNRPITNPRVGDLYYLNLGVADRGPAPVALAELVTTFVAPAGTEWASAFPPSCVEVRPNVEIRCTSQVQVPVDQGPIAYFTTSLKIVSSTVCDGEFRAESMGGELKPVDNVAKIVVDGVPRGNCATPTPTPPRPSASGGGTAGGSTLPVTGAPTGVIGLIAAMIIGLGVGVRLLGRRRNTEVR